MVALDVAEEHHHLLALREARVAIPCREGAAHRVARRAESVSAPNVEALGRSAERMLVRHDAQRGLAWVRKSAVSEEVLQQQMRIAESREKKRRGGEGAGPRSHTACRLECRPAAAPIWPLRTDQLPRPTLAKFR